MTRVVRDLEGRVVTSNRRQAVDSYARPYYHAHNSIRSIATALERWNPVFINRARQAEQQKWNREVEEGKAIAMQYAGKDYTLDQIEADIKAGNGGRYVALSKAQKEGINQLQLEQGLNNVSLKMQEAYDSATFKDVDGKEHRLYEAKDPMAFQKWFDEKYNELWESETGGVYDRSLYGELGSRHRAQSRNNLYSQFLSARGEMKSREADLAATQVLDTHFSSVLDKASYVGNSKALGDMRAVLNRVTNERDLVGSGGNISEGSMLATNYLLMKMGEATHNQEVQFLLNTAKGVTKIWDKPEYRSKLENFAENKRKQFEAEARKRVLEARQDAHWRLQAASDAERWKALRGTQKAYAAWDKYKGEVGNDVNRFGEVAEKILTDPSVAGDPFALSVALTMRKNYGNNIPAIMKASRDLYGGQDVNLYEMAKNGVADVSTILTLEKQRDSSDFLNKNRVFNYMRKSLESLIPKPDPVLSTSGDLLQRDIALNAGARMATESFFMQYGNQPVNSASVEFFQHAEQPLKDAVAFYSDPVNQERAMAEQKYNWFGEIAKTTPAQGDAKTFIASSGILADADIGRQMKELIRSHGMRLPTRNTPYAEEVEQNLAQKNYQFNDAPVRTLNDLCFIVNSLSNEEWAALVAGLNGGTSGNRNAQ